MSWEWSHTPDAYADARDQVFALPRQTLLTILREWAYHDRETSRDGRYRKPSFRLPAGIRQLSTEALADLVWDRAEAHRTCTNGGWEAYVCPDGCHTVPFEPIDPAEEA